MKKIQIFKSLLMVALLLAVSCGGNQTKEQKDDKRKSIDAGIKNR